MIRSNYDTLTLKLQENLDHYEKYSEKPKEAAFFTQLVSSWIQKKKKQRERTKASQSELWAGDVIAGRKLACTFKSVHFDCREYEKL